MKSYFYSTCHWTFLVQPLQGECQLMSRILLYDQIVGESNEFLHKLQVDILLLWSRKGENVWSLML